MPSTELSAQKWPWWLVVVYTVGSLTYLACDVLLERKPADKGAVELVFNVLATLATFGAVAASLWLARQEGRHAERQAASLAQMVAVRRYVELRKLHHVTGVAFQQIRSCRTAKEYRDAMRHVLDLKWRVDNVENETLVALAPLGERAALKVARALGAVSLVADEARNLTAAIEQTGIENLEDLRDRVGIVQGMGLDFATRLLGEALDEIGDAARVSEVIPRDWPNAAKARQG